MYICTYVHMYVCVYVCMYACMHACMYVCMYVFIYIYIYTHTLLVQTNTFSLEGPAQLPARRHRHCWFGLFKIICSNDKSR